jgi:hypothetical protein
MKMKQLFPKTCLGLLFFLLFSNSAANADVLKTQTNNQSLDPGFEQNSASHVLRFDADDQITFIPINQIIDNEPGLRNLLYGVNPTIYVTTEGIAQSSFEIPTVLNCKGNSINLLYQENELFNNVRAIVIMINNSNYSALDLSLLASFQNLEYILISFTFDVCNNNTDNCLLSLLQNMVQANSSDITILYELSIPN